MDDEPLQVGPSGGGRSWPLTDPLQKGGVCELVATGTCDRHLRLREAAATCDIERLRAILHPAVTLLSDAREPDVTGSVDNVARAAQRMMGLLNPPPGTAISQRSVNGRTGLLLTCGDEVTAVISVAVRGRRIDKIWIVLRPERLRGFNPRQ